MGRTKSVEKKIRITPEKNEILVEYLAYKGITLQEFLESYIDKVLKL